MGRCVGARETGVPRFERPYRQDSPPLPIPVFSQTTYITSCHSAAEISASTVPGVLAPAGVQACGTAHTPPTPLPLPPTPQNPFPLPRPKLLHCQKSRTTLTLWIHQLDMHGSSCCVSRSAVCGVRTTCAHYGGSSEQIPRLLNQEGSRPRQMGLDPRK